jgi:hypothetical protein
VIIHDCAQGTPEWADLRSGIPTASKFSRIFTKSGRRSDQRDKYMYELLAERMMGHPAQQFQSAWMARGNEFESKAVSFYELQRDLDTVKIGFVTNDAQTVGASPDRFVGDRGCLEVKVPKEGQHVEYLLKDGSTYHEYIVQAQGQLWIVGRDWSDVVSYHPEMPMALSRTERDEPFIRLLSEAVMEFSYKLEQKALELAERGWMPKDRAKAEPAFSKEVDLAFEAWNNGLSN